MTISTLLYRAITGDWDMAKKTSRPRPTGMLKATPELMPTAAILLGAICRDACVFEFGSGGSTLWLAGLADEVVSIEDDAGWYKAVKEELQATHRWVGLGLVETSKIAEAIDGTGEWDVVFVDCRDQTQRVKAIMRARKHIVANGWLVADDYNFPKVAKAVDKLRADGWDVVVMSGVKVHPVTNLTVKTATAFCRKPG